MEVLLVCQTSSTRIVISFYRYRLKPYNLQFKNRHISSRVPLVQPWKIVFFEQCIFADFGYSVKISYCDILLQFELIIPVCGLVTLLVVFFVIKVCHILLAGNYSAIYTVHINLSNLK